MGPVEKAIQEKLMVEFSPEHMVVENESYQHNVPAGSETHFRIVIVSDRFKGLSRVQRQRRVYEVLSRHLRSSEGIAGSVHALAQWTYTPLEWQQRRAPAASSPECQNKKQPV